MIPDSAVGIYSAETGARILTFSIDTCFVRRTIKVNCALWSAIWRRSNHLRSTRALAAITYDSGWVAIRTTRIGLTWVNIYRLNGENSWKCET